MRTIAEQNALYAQGRTKKGNIVTNAPGGSSYHNYGLAIDFALLLPDGKSVSWDIRRDGDNDKVADWQEVAQEAKKLGFEWGGDWSSFKDYSHLQMSFGLTTAELRAGKHPGLQQVKDALSRINGGDQEVNTDIKVNITLNGQKLTTGVLDSVTTYAPVRAIAEALGAKVTYDARGHNILKKLITSLACGTVLSMSLLGVGYASTAAGTSGMGGTAPVINSTTTDNRMGNMGNTMMNQTTGTMHKNETIMRDKIRTGDNSSVSPLNNTTPTGIYRAQSTTDDNDNNSNWGWLGLLGLLGLVGMRSRSGERH
ncbi:hypothetical protein KC345_g11521 [Hortaea werneckii]|nr:hypothetical protein KC345_g11521 [Hortaea werneckii]